MNIITVLNVGGGLKLKALNRQDIVDSLLQYLPEVATSLVNLVNNLQALINSNDPRNKEAVFKIINQLESLLTTLKLSSESVDVAKSDMGLYETDNIIELVELHTESLRNILLGITTMVKWVKNEAEPEGKLRESVDLLFRGGQQVIELVNKITKNEP